MEVILEIIFEVMFEIVVHTIPELWKASRLFRITVVVAAIIGALVVARAVSVPSL